MLNNLFQEFKKIQIYLDGSPNILKIKAVFGI